MSRAMKAVSNHCQREMILIHHRRQPMKKWKEKRSRISPMTVSRAHRKNRKMTLHKKARLHLLQEKVNQKKATRMKGPMQQTSRNREAEVVKAKVIRKRV